MKKVISLDALLLFILTLATMDQVPDDLSFWKGTIPWIKHIFPLKPELMVFGDPMKALYNVVKVSLLMVYLLIDMLDPLENKGKKAVHSLKLAIVSFIVFLSVIVPTVNWIAARHHLGPSRYANDGMIETEEAVKFLLKGENPYTSTYENTPVIGAVSPALWERYGINENPIIYHFPYPPLTFLSAVPVYAVSTLLFGWYDHRFLLLALFVLTMVLAYRIADDKASGLSIVIVLSLNPFGITEIKHGLNDTMLLFFIVWIIYLLKVGKTVAASAVLALACGSKQLAWVMVPFFFTYIYGEEKGTDKSNLMKQLYSKEAAVFAMVILIIFLPFLIWDGRSLMGDILSYHAGTTEHPYPLRGDAGYGFANLVLHFGLVNSPMSYFPFSPFQIVFTFPVLVWQLYRQIGRNSISQMMLGYTLTFFVFIFFGRYVAGNYLGYIFSLFTVSYFFPSSPSPSRG